MQFPSRYVLLVAAPLSLWTAGCTSTLHAAKPDTRPAVNQAAHQRLMAMAQVYEQKGDLQNAHRLFCQVLQQDPSNRVAREHAEDLTLAMRQVHDNSEPAPFRAQAQQLARQVEPSQNTLLTDEEVLARVPKPRPKTAPQQALATNTVDWAHEAAKAAQVAAARVQDDDESLDISDPLPVVNAARPHTVVVEQPIIITPAKLSAPPALLAAANATPVVSNVDLGDWSKTSLSRLCPTATAEVRSCIAKLDSNSIETRKEGLMELGDLGAAARSAEPAVRACLVDADAEVQAQAARACFEITGSVDECLPTLRHVVASDNANAIAFACYVLGSMGSQANCAIDLIAPLQNHESISVRIHAAEALLKISDGNSGSAIVLSNVLQTGDPEQRCMAAVALGSAKGLDRAPSIDALMAALQDANPSVQSAAALSLGGYGTSAARATPALQQASASVDEDTRAAIQTALSCILK